MDPPRAPRPANAPEEPRWDNEEKEPEFAQELIGGRRGGDRNDAARMLEVMAAEFPPRRETNPEEVRKEMVRRLIDNAREGRAVLLDDYEKLTPDEKQLLDGIYSIVDALRKGHQIKVLPRS
jgi:hypothetical protein